MRQLDPRIEAARSIGERFGNDQVIILLINSKTRVLEYASWGKTRTLCNRTRTLADKAFDAVGRAY